MSGASAGYWLPSEKIMIKHMTGACACFIAFFLLSSCASTEVTSYWKDAGYHRKPHKALIAARVKNKYQMAVEDEFARQLGKNGVNVSTATKEFVASAPANEEALKSYLRDHGYDTFILIRVTTEKDLLTNRPGSTAPWPSSNDIVHGKISSSDFIVVQRQLMTEANLYDVASWKLFWTAATETTVDEVNHQLITEYVAQILKKMRKSGLIS